MGFDQYHEPPEELPPATRTFARLCASLTEEAEAIGWYEQRIAVETDPEAVAVMRDAVGEEYKHFRWTSSSSCGARRRGARSPRGSSSRPATSSSTARRPRRRVRGRPGRPAPTRMGRWASAASEGRRDEPSPSSERTDQRRGLEHARRRGARAADAGAGRPQARRLLRPQRLAALGHQPRARRAAQSSRGRRDRAAPARAAAGRAARRLRALAGGASRRRSRRRGRRPRAP